jgi:AcrR family transcriptional regulator
MSRTRQRIIETSRLLFNKRGPNQITSLLIATEIGISPGNLYYHFHGKTQIICSLLDEFIQRVNKLPTTFEKNVGELSDYWPFIHHLLAECVHYRFIFQHSESICLEDVDARRRIRKLLLELSILCDMVLTRLLEEDAITLTQDQFDLLSQNLLLVGFNWLSYQQILDPNQSDQELIAHGIGHMASLLLPYLSSDALKLVPSSATTSYK